VRRIMVGVKRVVIQRPRTGETRQHGSRDEGVKMSINPFDEIALEEALRIKERGLADEVLVVSICPPMRSSSCAPRWQWAPTGRSWCQTDVAIGPLSVARIFSRPDRQGVAVPGAARKQAIDDDNGKAAQMLGALWTGRRPSRARRSRSRTARRP